MVPEPTNWANFKHYTSHIFVDCPPLIDQEVKSSHILLKTQTPEILGYTQMLQKKLPLKSQISVEYLEQLYQDISPEDVDEDELCEERLVTCFEVDLAQAASRSNLIKKAVKNLGDAGVPMFDS